MSAHLDRLNPSQHQAVITVDGPCLVLAGAGTGKTRVLTSRLAQVLLSQRATPHEVLAVTFTNKAAREMGERLQAMLPFPMHGMWIGTFHALCLRMLRHHAAVFHYPSNFNVIGTDDQTRLIKQVLAELAIDDKKYPPRLMLTHIQRWKDAAMLPDQLPPSDGKSMAAKVYPHYQQRLQQMQVMDFGDLILVCLQLLQRHPDILQRYQQRFRYVLVDEYQDTNTAQYLWIRLLTQSYQNICCVGDDDQSIYGWRGADVHNILRFEQDFPGATVIRLEQNYRSDPAILQAASAVIAHNRARLGKTLWTERTGGEPLVLAGLWDGGEEALWVSDRIEQLRRSGHSLKDMAILVRAGFQTREFEERFLAIGLPYKVVGALRFYDRQEIRDAVAYVRLVVNARDDLALERIINLPKRQIGAVVLTALHQNARDHDSGLFQAALRLTGSNALKARAKGALLGFVRMVERWQAMRPTMAPADLVQTVLEESGYLAMWKADKNPENVSRVENLEELLAAIAEFDALEGFLEHISLVTERPSEQGEPDMVSVMTVHSAKGLEFDSVFLPGWEEGVFPNARALTEGGVDALEEERRLAYVAITRARKRVLLSHAGSRRIHNQWHQSIPSRFLYELPRDSISQVGQRPLPQHTPKFSVQALVFDEEVG